MPKRHKQFTFNQKGFEKPKDWFGGSYQKNSHAKTKRPLDSKLPIHLVLRSEHAKGDISFQHPRHFGRVSQTVRQIAAKYGIKIHEFGNAGNHLHILLRIKVRKLWARFIRELTGRLAQIVLEIRGKQKGIRGGFWTQRPFTRIVKGWRRAYRVVKDYVVLNQLEGDGLISRLNVPHAGRRPRHASG